MKYRCVVIEAERFARDQMETFLSQLPNYEVVGSSSSEFEARYLLQNEEVDLLFLDVEMVVLIGIDFLRNLVKKPKIIFTTRHPDRVLTDPKLNVVDYLLKPILFEEFFKSILRFLEDEP